MTEIELSVVAPMFNEEQNVENTYSRIKAEMDSFTDSWEIIFVNDGSTDKTLEIAKLLESNNDLTIVSYSANKGRGYAIRRGISRARGKYIVTIDFDLSYAPSHITQIYKTLKSDASLDVVIGSAYMKGGKTEGVPFIRLLISKLSNRFFSFFSPQNIKTNTCVLRGYRSSVIKSLELRSDDKELHLEILSKLFSLGYKVKEIPATLKSRKSGSSKFKFLKFVKTHLEYSFYERPAALFGLLGSFFLISGSGSAIYLFSLFTNGNLNPERPLINATIVLILVGLQMLVFAVVTFQISNLNKELILIQRQNRILLDKLKR